MNELDDFRHELIKNFNDDIINSSYDYYNFISNDNDPKYDYYDNLSNIIDYIEIILNIRTLDNNNQKINKSDKSQYTDSKYKKKKKFIIINEQIQLITNKNYEKNSENSKSICDLLYKFIDNDNCNFSINDDQDIKFIKDIFSLNLLNDNDMDIIINRINAFKYNHCFDSDNPKNILLADIRRLKIKNKEIDDTKKKN